MKSIFHGICRGIGFCSLLILSLFILPLAAHSASKTVNIGVVCPLSGGGAPYGLDCARGIELAASEINAKGGITVGGEKYAFKVIAYDNELKPAVSIKMALRLRTLDNCPVIFTAESTSAFSLMKYNEKEKFILMGGTSAPEFTEVGNKLVIRDTTSFAYHCKAMRDVCWEQGIRKIGMLITAFESSKRWGDYFKKTWEEKGGQIVAIEETPVENRDFYSRLTKLMSAKPDAILVPAAADEGSALIVSQARELGFKGRFLFTSALDGAQLIKLAGAKAVEGCLIGGSGSPNSPEYLAYVKRYMKKYPNGVVQTAGPKGYEAMYMVAKAMEVAKTVTDVYKIRAAFPAVVPVPVEYRASGFTNVTAEGDMGSYCFVEEIKNGKKVNVSK